MSDEDEGYGLVMPFVCCASNGGEYHDASFVAGTIFGRIMEQSPSIGLGERKQWYVAPQMVAQVDLWAMHQGLDMTAEPWDEHPDEHILVTLSRPTIKETE